MPVVLTNLQNTIHKCSFNFPLDPNRSQIVKCSLTQFTLNIKLMADIYFVLESHLVIEYFFSKLN